jgi:tripartite-type tricarboxylate transporter receptor subunit TctC
VKTMLFRLCSATLACAASLVATSALAQNWPDRPVRILIGYSPGGTVDAWTRMLARRYEERFKQPFLVENRPGANATLATAAIAQGPTDGYLFSFIALSTQGKNFHKSVTYDTMTDFEPVTGLYSAPYAFSVNAATPFRSVKEVIDYAKANPGKLNFGTGVTTFALIATLMQKVWDVNVIQVPYKGQAPTLTALVSGEVQLMLDQPAAVKAMADAGKIRILGFTAERRMDFAPEVPTFAEMGYPNLTFAGSAMLWAKKGFPKEASDKINAVTPEILKLPEFVERLKNEGGIPIAGTQAQLWERFLRDARFMDEAAKAANYQPQ